MPFRAEACERQARLEGLGRQAGPVLERAPRAVPRILAVKFVALLRDLQRDHEPIGEGLGLGKANGAPQGVPGPLEGLLPVIGTGLELSLIHI